MKKTKSKVDSLRDKANKESRIKQVLNMPGWKDIMEIAQSVYNTNLTLLLEKEEPAARGAVNAITEFMNTINNELEFGKLAREKYNDIYAKTQKLVGGE